MISARHIANEISSGKLSPSQALELSAQNIADNEANLHVFAHLPAAPAKIQTSGPLTGIAIGIKDIFDTRDMPTAYNSAIYKTHQPVCDAPLVAMLRGAGASLIGKTVTTEFAWFGAGPTRNPHNTDHTPGGSSSGSAAGVAAGFFPAAVGSQTGGSIIRPASFCGVSGYKPSFRLFPTIAMKCFSWSLDTVGFFAASAADNAFVAQACSGRDLEVDQQDKSAPTIGVYRSAIDSLLSDEMKLALEKTIVKAEKAGAKVITITAPEPLEKAHNAHATVTGYEAHLALSDELTHNGSLLSQKLHAFLLEMAKITPQTYDASRRVANQARKASHALFDQCDVLLTLSALGAAPIGLDCTGDPVFNRAWTLLGMPTINVAGLTDSNNMPLGMQIIAPFGKDKRALQAAHWLEKQLGS